VLLSACSSLTSMPLAAQSDNWQPPQTWHEVQQRIDGLAASMVERGSVPGVVVGISLPSGDQQFYSYGIAASGSTEPLTKDSVFQVGSLSKGFLSALLEMLIEEGVFSWDDTLEDLFPSHSDISFQAKSITLLELATHTSGLPRQIFDLPQLSRFANFLFTGDNIYRNLDQAAIFSYLQDPSIHQRGQVQYSNIGYALIGLAIESRTSQNVDDLIERRLLAPLGLTATKFDADRLPAGIRRAHGHAGDQPKFVRRGTPIQDWEFDRALRSSAGAFSNARDLLRYASAHTQQPIEGMGQVLQHTLAPHACGLSSCAGLAWTIEHFPTGDIAYQVGLMGGYTSYIGINVQKQIAVVVLMNGFSWENKLGHTLLAEVPSLLAP
jgi:CubicO group peptidase (beta-lactamase class C family)